MKLVVDRSYFDSLLMSFNASCLTTTILLINRWSIICIMITWLIVAILKFCLSTLAKVYNDGASAACFRIIRPV